VIYVYLSTETLRRVISEFNIPPYVHIIMKYASKNVAKRRVENLSFYKDLEPASAVAICKVFVLSELVYF
jgi:sulfur relay (sulfurtransferase) DsrC/TusE family protein